MTFLLLALAFAAAGLVHGFAAGRTATQRIELILVYLLAGYHGVVMIGVAVFALADADHAAAMLDAPPGNVFQQFAAVMYLSMGAISVLSIRLRGNYLAGPVVMWVIYFLGATLVHLFDLHGHDHAPLLHGLVQVIAVHTLPPVTMAALGVWLILRRRADTARNATV